VIDERRSELVSRALDGDLDDAERADFERRLAGEPGLASALADARSLKEAVAALARGMQPSAELDAVIEPLRRGAPPTGPAIRPALRWLGAAAAVVLGVTVTLEVARRNPTPAVDRPTAPRPAQHDEREVFELAPLPSADRAKDRPIGATDRLLEEDLDQPEAPEPAALEVVGPLTSNEVVGEEPQLREAAPDTDRAAAAPPARLELQEVEGDSAQGTSGSPETGKAAPAMRRQPPPEPAPAGLATGSSAAGSEKSEASKSVVATFGGTGPDEAGRSVAAGSEAVLLVADAEVWRGLVDGCSMGRWSITIEVVNGAVVDLDLGVEVAALGEGCRIDDMIGALVSGVDDGRRPAELVVRPAG
jgi:hypothetical protein